MSLSRALVLVLVFALVAGAPRHAGAAAAARKPATPPKTAAADARRLDDIHIEGEIAVPQVLFITARDQRRFLDFQHRRYLKTSVAVGEAATLPSRIAVIQNPKLDARKEIAP
jgi:hypothetical protein